MCMCVCRWGIAPEHVFSVLKRKLCCAGNESLSGGKIGIIECYFHSYGSGHEVGPSLKKAAEQFRERFNKTAPSNTVMLSIIMKFRQSGSVLCQQKEKSG
jgi:hypothetical protein